MKKNYLTSKKSKKIYVFLIKILVFVLSVKVILSVRSIWSEFEHREWVGSNLVAFVGVNDAGVCLAGVIPNEKIVYVKIDKDVMLPLSRGYGEYRIGVVDKLGEQEGLGSRLLEEGIENWLGVVVLTVYDKKDGECNLGLRQGLNILSNSKIEFNWFDKFKLVKNIFLRGKNGDMFEISDEDGGRKNVDLARLALADQTLKTELISVGVVNKTNRSGLADSASEILNRLDYDVLINEWDEGSGGTLIKIDESIKEDYEKLFPLFKWVDYPVVYEEELFEKDRVMIKIELGEDFAIWLRGK